MELTVIINAFKEQDGLSNKSLAVIGGDECSIVEMERLIDNGFTSENIVLCASNSNEYSRGAALVERNSTGLYIVSSDIAMCGVVSIPVTDIDGVIFAVLSVLG